MLDWTCSWPLMSPQPGRLASMSAPEAGLAAVLCTDNDVTCQLNTAFESTSRDSAEAPGKSLEASLLEIRQQ